MYTFNLPPKPTCPQKKFLNVGRFFKCIIKQWTLKYSLYFNQTQPDFIAFATEEE